MSSQFFRKRLLPSTASNLASMRPLLPICRLLKVCGFSIHINSGQIKHHFCVHKACWKWSWQVQQRPYSKSAAENVTIIDYIKHRIRRRSNKKGTFTQRRASRIKQRRRRRNDPQIRCVQLIIIIKYVHHKDIMIGEGGPRRGRSGGHYPPRICERARNLGP